MMVYIIVCDDVEVVCADVFCNDADGVLLCVSLSLYLFFSSAVLSPPSLPFLSVVIILFFIIYTKLRLIETRRSSPCLP